MTPELKNACELIFQEHKASNYPVTWNRDAFRGRISTGLCEMGKETLLRKNIIYYPNPAKKILTKLNPAVSDADSFEEASYLVLNKVPLLSARIINDNRNQPLVANHVSTFARRPVSQRLITFAGKTESIAETKWYITPIFIYLLWPVCAAVIFWFIAYLIGTAYTALFFDLK